MQSLVTGSESGGNLSTGFEQLLARLGELAPRILAAVLVLAATVVLSRWAGRMTGSLLGRGRMTEIQLGFFRQLVARLVQLAGVAAMLGVLGFSGVATWLLASGGIVAVILGFAFRQIGENLIAGVFLAYRSPFRIGDLIRCGSLEGVVRSIDLRATHIRTGDGSDIFIPNATILGQPVVNFTLDGNRRAEFELRLGVESDLREVARVLRLTSEQVPGVSHDPTVDLQLQDFEGAWARVRVTLWVDVFEEKRSLETVRSLTMDACRRALVEAGFRLESDGG